MHRRKRIIAKAVLLLAMLAIAAVHSAETDFSSVEIDEPFQSFLTAKKSLMACPGVKEFRVNADGRYIVSVVSVESKGRTAKDVAAMMKVCRIKAQNEILKATCCEISSVVQSTEKTVTVGVGDVVQVTSISSFLDVTEQTARGFVCAWPVVGTWFSKDGTEFFLAIGRKLQSAEQ